MKTLKLIACSFLMALFVLGIFTLIDVVMGMLFKTVFTLELFTFQLVFFIIWMFFYIEFKNKE